MGATRIVQNGTKSYGIPAKMNRSENLLVTYKIKKYLFWWTPKGDVTFE